LKRSPQDRKNLTGFAPNLKLVRRCACMRDAGDNTTLKASLR